MILIAVLAVFACSRQQEGFKINVKLDGAKGDVVLEKRGTTGWVGVDTATIVDGTAVLEGETDYPHDYYLSIPGQRNKAILFVENTEMNVTGSADSINKVTVTGSQTHDEFETLNKPISKISQEYMDIYRQVQQLASQGDTAKARELMEQVNEMYMNTIELQKEFVANHPGSYVSPYLLGNLQNRLEVGELDSLVSALEPNIDTLQQVVALKDRIEQLKKVAVGQTAPDFTMNDPEGNPVKFSDVYSKNELTLLDFWAGWCGPCRQENPNVVAVYNDFKDDGFTVFGVSLDRSKEDWLKAVEEDNLTWTHVSDLNYWNNAAAKMYQVQSIPANFLVDSSGKILARNIRGEELRKTVAEEIN